MIGMGEITDLQKLTEEGVKGRGTRKVSKEV